MQIRVAEACGIASYGTGDDGDNTARPPTDPNRLRLVKDRINDAILEISRGLDMSGEKPRIHSWSWLKDEYSLVVSETGTAPQCVDADPTLYALPHCTLAITQTTIGWTRLDSGYGQPMKAPVTNWQTVLRANIDNLGVPGPPRAVAFRRDGASRNVGERGRPQLLVTPIPDAPYVLNMQIRLSAPKLVADTDRGPWPESMDLVIVDRAAYLIDRFNSGRGPMLAAQSNKSMAEAIEEDKQRALEPAGDSRSHLYNQDKYGFGGVYLNGSRIH